MAAFQYGGIIEQIQATATAAGTTTLINTSKQLQVFTGTTTQTVVLPNATTYSTPGAKFEIYNESTGALTIQFNGGGSFTDAAGISYGTLAPNTSLTVHLQTNGTAAGTWAVSTSGISALVSGNPSGAVVMYGGTSAPTGYLFCDGTSYSTSTYPALFAAIGYTFGGSGGSFNVPNTGGVFPRGGGSQTIAGISYSSSLGSVVPDQFQGHYHVDVPGGPINLYVATDGAGSGATDTGTAQRETVTQTGSPVTDNSNGVPRTGLETRPAGITFNFIIKT
jgi:microcystin-dependent protein